ncbi:MAG: hypothetical protein ABIU05_19075, partial [Nitrospirales bacterium]
LRTEFDFVREQNARNPYAVVFSKAETTILVEGVNWGFGANVLISRGPLTAPLWAIALARGRRVQPTSGQLGDLKEHATLLREFAVDILGGDASFYQAALSAMDLANGESITGKIRRLP